MADATQTDRLYRLFGAELSPYSVKVRAYFRYKGIPHRWIARSAADQEEFQKYAKLPLVPLVVTPDGEGIQDSTPILERFETSFPDPTIHPADPATAFLSALIEEYGDEWVNKPMFHYRWTYPADQDSSGERLARAMFPDIGEAQLPQAAAAVKQRMIPRLRLVGSCDETREVIEGSYRRTLEILERHLATRPYLFGGRPAFGDFGLAAQLYQCSTDPTPGALMRRDAPRVLAWSERMQDPRAQGEFEPWEALEPTLLPLLRDEVGAIFLPWSTANAQALAAGQSSFTVELGGKPFTQETQKYHARSLAALRARYDGVADRRALNPVLKRAGCLSALR
jgi:glutathione S-transferase